MLTPQRVLRIVVEIMFMLLGGIVVWLGSNGQIFFDRRRLSWLFLSIAVLLWGLRALYKPGPQHSRWEQWSRGLSLTLLGIVMLAISRVPFGWVGRLLALAGVLLAVRGVVGLVLTLRLR
jgi:hypothetical protein